MSEAYEQVEVASAAELRAWLEEHHASSPGIWLVTGKKAAGERYVAYEDLVRQALCFGWIDGQARPLDALRSQQLLTPRRPRSGWSRPNKLRVAELEAAGLMAPAGRAAVAAAKVSGTWNSLDLVEDLVVPPDLAAALDAEPGAREHWQAYPRSVKRFALEQVYGAKRAATREKRVAATVALAAADERPAAFRRAGARPEPAT
ncbi:Uncharacterized conserved protein YdeI, YjbR/CyaY-like superfamily, DUF1801 family [Microlunatus sagamiharensis]|uniref:Uncharacterized conserved protein YdeI, YjbR/CyaY-like superfamily, DUF1801 family n=1 Tax=Microlunatus sagamiharensis TaxID=546874 RepID=A0A1H2MU76_9ACTN|nr:YdeI/OmpD-associated family protein [Microlunatus sagamiharensis]SDU96106.1 Uncharacterized conserved protein YdeI, YjbR/CyaY-like superfamily, DUF1801 family [Microlunatus sagamiharensis]